MSRFKSLSQKRTAPPFLLVLFAAVALALPFLLQFSSTVTRAESGIFPDLVTNLTGDPIGGVTPHGFGAYFVSNSSRRLTTNVFDVNLPEGTQLTVCLNTDNIGTLTLGHHHEGSLTLSTEHGDTVPTVVAGDTLTVKNGETAILTGTFAAFMTPTPHPSETETPEPSETPTASPTGTPFNFMHFFAPLSGPPIGGVLPRGLGSFVSFNDFRRLEVFVSHVNLEEGQVLTVNIGEGNSPDVVVGTITLDDHEGALHLDTRHGDTVPVVVNGTPINITDDGGNTVLSGVFSDMPPTPSPTPSETPTATPTPHPAHVFAARLNGANEVPPVMTEGRGAGVILLNQAETSISVTVGYRHLSSDVTAITINGPAMAGENAPVIFTLDLPMPPHSVAHGTFDLTAEQVDQLRTGLWYFQIATTNNPDGEIRGQIHSVNHRDDFGGDGISDISVTRRSDNGVLTWYVLDSSDRTVGAETFGQAADLNVQGDYDGDGIADVSVFTPAAGNWQVRGSATHQTLNYHWGQNGDIPVVGDYDGDGINDLAVFRPSDGNWYVRRSSDLGVTALHWGTNGDRPVSGDFDGDGRNDMAVFRPSNGNWYVNRSSDGQFVGLHWGTNGDQPVAGDFDGDGTSDMAVFRPSEGNWYINRSSDSQVTALHFGLAGDIPVPCEFDGDGQTDIAVFRPSDGNWYINLSSDQSVAAYHFGLSTDHPGPAVYAP